METAEQSRVADDAARVRRLAWTVLLLRGTGIASVGVISLPTLALEDDPVWRWATLPLGAGLLLMFLVSASMRKGGRSGRFAVGVALLPVLGWVFVALTPVFKIDPFGLRKEPLALALLPAFFLPDLFALWVFLRLREAHRGHLLVARSMAFLSAFSSLAVSWFGSVVFLA